MFWSEAFGLDAERDPGDIRKVARLDVDRKRLAGVSVALKDAEPWFLGNVDELVGRGGWHDNEREERKNDRKQKSSHMRSLTLDWLFNGSTFSQIGEERVDPNEVRAMAQALRCDASGTAARAAIYLYNYSTSSAKRRGGGGFIRVVASSLRGLFLWSALELEPVAWSIALHELKLTAGRWRATCVSRRVTPGG